MKKYSHLTPEQRYTIDVLLQNKTSRKKICEILNISQSTLCRELKRNSGQRGYHCKQAQVKAEDRKRRLQNYRNLTLDLRRYIRDKITTEQWSPAQIVGYLRSKGEKCVCIETIYAYIRSDRAAGGDLWEHCRHKLKHRKRQPTAPYMAVQNRTMIDERPTEWDGSTPGDFEMDTIVGKDGKGTLLLLPYSMNNISCHGH